LPGETGEHLVLGKDHRASPPGHHHPASERVPKVGICQHSADVSSVDQRGKFQADRSRKRAVGIRRGERHPMTARTKRGTKSQMREDIPVSADRG
jgi:hypothetical protein